MNAEGPAAPHPDETDARLAAGAGRLAASEARLAAAEPWPLSERFDHAPEASWGPPEVIAHVVEMLDYWLSQAERVTAMTTGPQPFGRLATDTERLARIDHERALPIHELVAEATAGIERWRGRWATLDAAARARTGLHPTLGEMSVGDIATRFVVGHLEDHLDQLEELEAAHLDEGTQG
jgi:hypothetical protein